MIIPMLPLWAQIVIYAAAAVGGALTLIWLRRWWIGANGMIGATFVRIDSRGCMAEDRVIKWIGVGKYLEKSPWAGHGPMIYVEIVQQTHMPNDIRDGGQGGGSYDIRDGAIQKIAPGLYFIFG